MYVSCLVTSDSLQLHGLYLAPLSMGFSRQEYWNGLPFPSQGDLCHPEIKPGSLASQANSLMSGPPGKPPCNIYIFMLHKFYLCKYFIYMLLTYIYIYMHIYNMPGEKNYREKLTQGWRKSAWTRRYLRYRSV